MSSGSKPGRRVSPPLPIRHESEDEGEEVSARSPAAQCPTRQDPDLRLHSNISRRMMRHTVGEYMLRHRPRRTAKRIAAVAHALEKLRLALETLYEARHARTYGPLYWKCHEALTNAQARVGALPARTPVRIAELMHDLVHTLTSVFQVCPPPAGLPADLVAGLAKL